MNTNKLYKWKADGTLDKNLSKLTTKQLNLLKQSIYEELDRYIVLSENYTERQIEKCSIPHTNKLKSMIDIIDIYISESNKI